MVFEQITRFFLLLFWGIGFDTKQTIAANELIDVFFFFRGNVQRCHIIDTCVRSLVAPIIVCFVRCVDAFHTERKGAQEMKRDGTRTKRTSVQCATETTANRKNATNFVLLFWFIVWMGSKAGRHTHAQTLCELSVSISSTRYSCFCYANSDTNVENQNEQKLLCAHTSARV